MSTPNRQRAMLARATTAILAAGFLARLVRYAVNMPLWGDEAFVAVSLLTRSFAGLGRPLEYYQIAPIGFLWAELAVVKLLGASEWALRLLPFLAGIGTLWLFARFATANLDRRSALMAVAIMAASFYPIRHANEVKPYAIDLFLSMVVTCLARAAWRDPGSLRAWTWLTLAGAVGVWVSYPLIFVVSGVGGVLAVRVFAARSLRGIVVGLLFAGTILASWAVMYVNYGRPQDLAAPFLSRMPTWEGSFPPLTRPWALPWWLLSTHSGNMMAYPYGGPMFGSVLTFLLAVRGAFALGRRDRWLLAMLLAPLLPAMAAAALHRYPYGTSARISLFFAPAACLLAGRGIAAILARRLPRWRVRRGLLRIAAVLGAFAVATAAAVAVVPYKDPVDVHYRRMVADLADLTRPGDRWIAFDGMVALPEVPELMLMPWLQHAAQFHFYALRDAPVPIDWMPRPEAETAATGGRTWFLLHWVGYDRFPDAMLRQHLDRLDARLGTPTICRMVPNPGEYVAAYAYPAPGAPSIPPAAQQQADAKAEGEPRRHRR